MSRPGSIAIGNGLAHRVLNILYINEDNKHELALAGIRASSSPSTCTILELWRWSRDYPVIGNLEASVAGRRWSAELTVVSACVRR